MRYIRCACCYDELTEQARRRGSLQFLDGKSEKFERAIQHIFCYEVRLLQKSGITGSLEKNRKLELISTEYSMSVA